MVEPVMLLNVPVSVADCHCIAAPTGKGVTEITVLPGPQEDPGNASALKIGVERTLNPFGTGLLFVGAFALVSFTVVGQTGKPTTEAPALTGDALS